MTKIKYIWYVVWYFDTYMSKHKFRKKVNKLLNIGTICLSNYSFHYDVLLKMFIIKHFQVSKHTFIFKCKDEFPSGTREVSAQDAATGPWQPENLSIQTPSLVFLPLYLECPSLHFFEVGNKDFIRLIYSGKLQMTYSSFLSSLGVRKFYQFQTES